MAETITSVAVLLWPLFALIVLLVFGKPLVRVVRSAEQREVHLEFGGQKLSLGQLNEQQNRMISDMQTQISALHRRLAELDTRDASPSDPDLVWSQRISWDVDVNQVPPAVLWVDDMPSNNALIVEQLQQNGTRVDLVSSTAEALTKLGGRRYGVVLSDMTRFEDGSAVSTAGLQLLTDVRERLPDIPFLIYCGTESAKRYREEAISSGADVITASPGVLIDQLHALGLL